VVRDHCAINPTAVAAIEVESTVKDIRFV